MQRSPGRRPLRGVPNAAWRTNAPGCVHTPETSPSSSFCADRAPRPSYGLQRGIADHAEGAWDGAERDEAKGWDMLQEKTPLPPPYSGKGTDAGLPCTA